MLGDMQLNYDQLVETERKMSNNFQDENVRNSSEVNKDLKAVKRKSTN